VTIYFTNDGSYGEKAVGIPVLINKTPIGFVSEVSAEKITCHIWDRFVNREQPWLNVGSSEQDIYSIGIVL